MIVSKRQDGISFRIEEIEKNNEGKRYHVELVIPFSYGWIDFIDFVTGKNGKIKYQRLQHLKNEDDKAYFITNIFLETWALYHFYFKVCV